MYYNQTIYIPKAIGVKEYAYDEEINNPYREQMEDFYFIKDNILEDGSQSILFGILDGHGGQDVAKFVQTNFPKVNIHHRTRYLSNCINKNKDQLINCYKILLRKQSYFIIKTNELVKKECNSAEIGTTASIGFIRLEGAKRVLYFANVGDSRAFLFGDTVIPLTTDHKPTNQIERARIKQNEGTVIMDRLNGILAISRAIGDHSFTQYGLISTPDQVRIELRLSHKWIVVASDGLWDVINEQVIYFIILGTLIVYKIQGNCRRSDKVSSKISSKTYIKRQYKYPMFENLNLIFSHINIMRNSSIQRHSGFLKPKNSVNLSDLTAQESSNYRMRFTPMSSPASRQKGTIIIKSHETIVLNMLSSTHRQIDSPFKMCQYCTEETGQVRQYCKCKGITYHEKCIQDNAKKKVKKIKEQAFICSYDCSYPYRIEGYYMRDINKFGKILMLIIAIILILLIIVWILICIFWENLYNLQLVYLFGGQIVLLISITILLRKLKVNYYVLHWRILPYLVNDSKSHHSEMSLSTILPFLLQERDVVLYKTDKEEDPIIEQ